MLRSFGLERPSFPLFCKAIGMLFLFGLSVNGSYEAYHLIAVDRYLCPDVVHPGGIGQIVACLLPLVVFIWLVFHYLKEKLNDPVLATGSPDFAPRQGVILALSIPRARSGSGEYASDAVNVIIDTAASTGNLEAVFNIVGFGQLARSVYQHRERLRCVWLLTTEKTQRFVEAFQYFLERFVPGASVVCVDDDVRRTRIDDASDQRSMESAKDIVADILSRKNLERVRLRKSDVIVDITGGTKLISVGMVFGALQTGIDFQYVQQKDNQVVSMRIPVEIVLDKVADYLREIQADKATASKTCS